MKLLTFNICLNRVVSRSLCELPKFSLLEELALGSMNSANRPEVSSTIRCMY